MDLTTFIIFCIIIVVAIVISLFIDDKTYKIYYFLILALAGLTFLNCYLAVIYYIKLRNEPGVPGPRGPKGDNGPTGSQGKCVLTDKCGFDKKDIDYMLYDMAASVFQTNKDCIKTPSLSTCSNPTEVERIKPVSVKMKQLEDLALQGNFTKQELKQKINKVLGDM